MTIDDLSEALQDIGIVTGHTQKTPKILTPRWNKNKPTILYEMKLHNSNDIIKVYYTKRGDKLVRVAVGDTIMRLGKVEAIARQIKKGLKLTNNSSVQIAPRELKRALRGIEDEDTSKLERRLKLLTPSTDHKAYLIIDESQKILSNNGENFTRNNMQIDIFTKLETAKKKAVSVGAYGVVEI